MRWFVFPICHTHALALLSHYFKSVTCVCSVIFSLQRPCTGCHVPFSDPRCFLPVTVYGITHAHLVHMCWPLLWGLRQMGCNFATFATYALVGSLQWIMRVLNSQGLGGALSAVCAQCVHSATIWASSRIGDPYFVILGGIIVAPSVGLMLSSTLGIWHFWIFTHFHPFPPLFTLFLLISTMDSHTLVWALGWGDGLPGFCLTIIECPMRVITADEDA